MATKPVVPKKKNKNKLNPTAETYDHKGTEALLRPEIGLQAQFKQKRPPKTYRYDSSLSPALDWDDDTLELGLHSYRTYDENKIGSIEGRI